jgi:DNA adenine methylase
MPPHDVYIEPFLGSGAVMRLKVPARLNIGVDLDPDPLAVFGDAVGGLGISAAAEIARSGRAIAAIAGTGDRRPSPAPRGRAAPRSRPAGLAENGDWRSSPDYRLLHGDAISFLAGWPFTGRELVYCDPPYMMESRGPRRIYRCEMADADHGRLLDLLRLLPCRVMISGYWTPLYARKLKSWESVHYPAMTRGGTRDEWLWMNFPEPVALHDYRYLGSNFRERERIKRKKLRWTRRLDAMPLLERRALLSAIEECCGPSPSDLAVKACRNGKSGDAGRDHRRR